MPRSLQKSGEGGTGEANDRDRGIFANLVSRVSENTRENSRNIQAVQDIQNSIPDDLAILNPDKNLLFDDEKDNLLEETLSKNSNLYDLFQSTSKSNFASTENKEN